MTTGGSTNPADYPAAAGHPGKVAEVFAAAAGYGRATASTSRSQIAGGVVLAAAVVALFAARPREA